MSIDLNRRLQAADERRWARLIYAETILLVVLLVLLVAIVVVGIRFEHAGIFTNTGLIVVFAALLAETTRRLRHFAIDRRLRAPASSQKGPTP